jgi:hypothetical protein
MPLYPPEELTLLTLRRKLTARLRRLTRRSGIETPVPDVCEASKTTTREGVPLVLPFDPERRLIPRLLRRLRRGRFLRQFPGSLNEYALLSEDATCYLIDRLHNVRVDGWKECVTAVWALGRLTSDDPARREVAELLYWLVGRQSDNMACIDRKRLAKRWRAIWRILFVGILVWGLVAWSFISRVEIVAIAAVNCLLLSVPVTILSFIGGFPLDAVRMSRIRAMAILTLGRWREPCHMDILLREYAQKSGRVRSAAEVALAEVLPLLTTEERLERPSDFVPNLCRVLHRKERQLLDYTVREETLEGVLLEALGKVGDGRALPLVERIATRGRTPRLRELAQSILPVLYARSREANEPKQLLRGAVCPDTAPNTLLRATQETPTPPSQLLRPH